MITKYGLDVEGLQRRKRLPLNQALQIIKVLFILKEYTQVVY